MIRFIGTKFTVIMPVMGNILGLVSTNFALIELWRACDISNETHVDLHYFTIGKFIFLVFLVRDL